MKTIITLALAAAFAAPALAVDNIVRSESGRKTVTPLTSTVVFYKRVPDRAEYSMLWQMREVNKSGVVVDEERMRINVMGCDDGHGSVWSTGNNDLTLWAAEGEQMFDQVALFTCKIGARARASYRDDL